ncbi:MAG: PilW family protein [Vicinamibacterales bacterium]
MRGFTLPEALIAMWLSMTVTGAIFLVVQPSQAVLQAQLEAADLQQRLRYAVDAIARDLVAAATVLPYRIGAIGHDPASGIFYRPDTMTATFLTPLPPGGQTSATYYLRPDGSSGAFQLMQYDGGGGDFPLLDHVVALAFEYTGVAADGITPESLAPAMFVDGPWLPDAGDPDRVDADTRRIRRVRVRIRLEATQSSVRGPAGLLFARPGTATSPARYVPDREIHFDASPRNAVP